MINAQGGEENTRHDSRSLNSHSNWFRTKQGSNKNHPQIPLKTQNCLCSQGLDAGDGSYLFDGGAKGHNGGLHLPVDSGNGSIEGVDLIEMKTQEEAMLRRHAAAQNLA